MSAVIGKFLRDSAAGVRRDVLERRWVRSGGGDDDAIAEGVVFFQGADDLGHGGLLLADGDVDADHVLALEVEDGVNGDGGFPRLAGRR